MSVLFAYICTRSTVDPYVPAVATNITRLARDVSDGFTALSGGHFTVGKLAFFPVQLTLPNHLLCDGREVTRASFPELYDLIGDTQGTPSSASYFVLPNFVNAPLTTTTTAAPETAVQGTVSAPTGDVDSGGRATNGTSASDTSFSTINSTTFAPITDELVVIVGSAGQVDLNADLNFSEVGTGSTPVLEGIWQHFNVATSVWDDVAVLNASVGGDLTATEAMTGLAVSSSHKFRYAVRRTSGTIGIVFTGLARATGS